MKKTRLLLSFCLAFSTMLLLYSCGPGEEKKADETTVTADTTATKTPETPVTAKPANVLIIWHKVTNFDKWLSLYEAHDSARLANGLHNYVIGRGAKDPNMVLVALQMDDAEKAKQFGASADLKEAMKKGGVTGTPSVSYVDVQSLDTTTNAAATRVMITHKVKDWDAWKKEFDSHKQIRIDAGLTDRAVGYAVGDNHSVMVVCAVSDMKKAEAFFASKDLQEKMSAAGVEGPPTIMYYTVAKKY